MSETKVVRGLFFGLCLALFLGVAVTVPGPGSGVAQGAVVTASTSAPSPTAASIVSRAPEGTFVIAVFDLPKVMADPALKSIVGSDVPEGMDLAWFSQMTLYIISPSSPKGAPTGGGVVTITSDGAPKAAAWLKKAGSPITVAGEGAYKILTRPARPAMMGMPAQPAEYTYIAMPDADTFVGADTEDVLGVLLTARKRAAHKDAQMADLLGKYSGAGVQAAFQMTPALLAQIKSDDETKPGDSSGAGAADTFDPATIKGGALRVDVTKEGYDAEATSRFTTADAATKAVTDAKAAIAEFQKQLQPQLKADPRSAQMLQPLLDLLAKIVMKSKGNDATFGLKATQQEFQGAFRSTMTIMMMQSMGPGGAQGGAMGPGMPPAMPQR